MKPIKTVLFTFLGTSILYLIAFCVWFHVTRIEVHREIELWGSAAYETGYKDKDWGVSQAVSERNKRFSVHGIKAFVDRAMGVQDETGNTGVLNATY